MSDFFSQPERIYFVPPPLGKGKNFFLEIGCKFDLPPIGKEKKYFLKIKGNLDQALIGKVKNFLQKQGVDLNDPL